MQKSTERMEMKAIVIIDDNYHATKQSIESITTSQLENPELKDVLSIILRKMDL